MGSVVHTPATYDCTCDLCGTVVEDSPTDVPDQWAIVTGPGQISSGFFSRPFSRPFLLCSTCVTGYLTFWRL